MRIKRFGNRLKKKNKSASLKLDNFPGFGLHAFPVVANNEEDDDNPFLKDNRFPLIKKLHSTHETESVPTIPKKFYSEAVPDNSELSHEVNQLIAVRDVEDEDISVYLDLLQRKISADKIWFAITSNETKTFRMIDAQANGNDSISSDNELIIHAMSINHLMFVKNKNYIDALLDNQCGLTSLFIVPVNSDSYHGMLLAGYKSNQLSVDDIVVALDKSKSTLATFL